MSDLPETTTEPTAPGHYWARRDGDLRGEMIELSPGGAPGDGLCWTMGCSEPESIHAFFLFVGPVENLISVEAPRD